MGGFGYVVHDNDSQGPRFHYDPSEVERLDIVAFRWVLNHDSSILPDISEESILDKSKAHWLAKSILLIQALWFCANALARLIQGLSISLLEVTTFAHAFCTLITYALWWKKPLNVHEPTVLNLWQSPSEPEDSADNHRITTALALSTLGAIYGLPHVIARNSTFPSTMEQHLWRIAAFFVCFSPAVSLIIVLSMMVLEQPKRFPELPVVRPFFHQIHCVPGDRCLCCLQLLPPV